MTEGVKWLPRRFGMISAFPFRKQATRLFVVPKSIPISIVISSFFLFWPHQTENPVHQANSFCRHGTVPVPCCGSRIYLQGMANYGIHFTKVNKTVVDKNTGEEKDVVRYAAHLGPNPYYWTKLQIDDSIKVPTMMVNPSYDKIIKIIGG